MRAAVFAAIPACGTMRSQPGSRRSPRVTLDNKITSVLATGGKHLDDRVLDAVRGPHRSTLENSWDLGPVSGRCCRTHPRPRRR